MTKAKTEEKEKEKPQKQRFIDKARELECDDRETAFDRIAKKLIKPPANTSAKKPTK